MQVKYRNGLPTKSSIEAALKHFWKDCTYMPRISGTYKYTGALVWERDIINEKLEEFIVYLKSIDIEVESYGKHISPTTGSIILKSNKTNE